MGKRVAVLVRERQDEALRVSLGLTLAGCIVEVYLLDRVPDPSPDGRLHLETLADVGVPVAANRPGGPLPLVETAEMARRVLSCDHVFAY